MAVQLFQTNYTMNQEVILLLYLMFLNEFWHAKYKNHITFVYR